MAGMTTSPQLRESPETTNAQGCSARAPAASRRNVARRMAARRNAACMGNDTACVKSDGIAVRDLSVDVRSAWTAERTPKSRCAILLRVPGFVTSRCSGGFWFAAALPQALDQQIEHRNEERVQYRAHDHAPEYGGAYGVASVFSSAARGNQGDNPQDESQRRHKNRTQPDACGFDGGVEDRHTASAQLLGEFDDQDGVLGREADQHDESHLAEDVVLLAAEPLCGKRAEQCHRHG